MAGPLVESVVAAAFAAADVALAGALVAGVVQFVAGVVQFVAGVVQLVVCTAVVVGAVLIGFVRIDVVLGIAEVLALLIVESLLAAVADTVVRVEYYFAVVYTVAYFEAGLEFGPETVDRVVERPAVVCNLEVG